MATFSSSGGSKSTYDPQKAHEYYEKHKKLKGRSRSTKGFSQEQKEQFSAAKDQLREEWKEKREGITESLSQQRQEMTEQAKKQIEQLRDIMKNMSPEQKKQFKATIEKAIGKIRDGLKAQKTALTESGKSEREAARQEYQAGIDEAHKQIAGG